MKMLNLAVGRLAMLLLPVVTLAGCATAPLQTSAQSQVYREHESQPVAPAQRPADGVYRTPQSAPTQTPSAPAYFRPVETNNAAAALLHDANAALSKSDFTRAVSAAERAQRVAPRDPDVYLTLSRIRCAQSNYGQCEQLARKAISLQPSLPQREEAQRLIARAKTAE